MKLIKNLSWIFFANAFSSFTKWLIVVIIAKTMDPTTVGIYSLAFAVGAPIALFANMRLRALYITGTDDNLSSYISTRNILSVAGIVTLVIIGQAFYPSYFLVILLVGLSKILDLHSDIYYSVPHKKNNLNTVGKLIIIKQFFLIIIFFISIVFFENLTLSLLLLVLSQSLIFYLIEKRYIVKKYNIILNKKEKWSFKGILLLGLPLGLTEVLASLTSNYPRYILEYFESAEVLGYFSAIMYIVMIFGIFIGAMTQVILPRLSVIFQNKNIQLFKRYVFVNMMFISILTSLVLILFVVLLGKQFLTIVYGIEYANYYNILIIASISISVNLFNKIFDAALMAMRYISVQPKITFLSLVFTVVTGYYLVTNYGIIGTALTVLFGYTFQTVCKVYFVSKRLKAL